MCEAGIWIAGSCLKMPKIMIYFFGSSDLSSFLYCKSPYLMEIYLRAILSSWATLAQTFGCQTADMICRGKEQLFTAWAFLRGTCQPTLV